MADGATARPEDALDWKCPDYSPIYAARSERIRLIRKTEGMREALWVFYATHPVEFITDWCMTADPRNAGKKDDQGRPLPVVMPFIMFGRQRDFIQWLYDRWMGREDGLCEKTRDMGVSWLCVAFGVWMWIFHPNSVIGFGSRKEEYVDEAGDPKSLFWKIRKLIELLPLEFRPIGFSFDRHSAHMRIINPANGSALVGEAGKNIGRGARASIYFKDESAFYESPEAVDAALSQTSDTKIDVSTPNGSGNPFYRKRHGGKIKVFTFHWRDDPRKGPEWYAKQVATLDAVVLAQEVDIDYAASIGDSWIPGAPVAAAQRTKPSQVEAIGGWIIGVDAAHFGDDSSVIHKRRGRLNLQQVKRQKLDGPQLAALVETECDDLVEAGGFITAIIIELDGPGVSCYDQLKLGRYAHVVVGIHTGAKLKDNRNYNVRAKAWRNAREYLEDTPCSLAPDGEISSQLTAMKYSFKDGVLLIQSKKEYKAANGRSPDEADAFVLTHAPFTIRAAGRPAQKTTQSNTLYLDWRA